MDDESFQILSKCSRARIMGAHLLVNLLGYELANSFKFKSDALASFMINRVHEVDPSVGSFEGDGYIMRARYDKGNTLVLDTPQKSSAEYFDQTQTRTEIIRSTWELCDHFGNEKRFLKELAKLERKFEA